MPEKLSLALQHHQAGRLQEAEAIYRQVLQAQPNCADAFHLLGLIAQQTGRAVLAMECVGKAIQLNPSAGEFHNSMGEAHRAQGKLEEAEVHYRRALAITPLLAEAHCNLGIILRWYGKTDEAVSHLQRALAIKPSLAQAHHNLGTVFQDQGKLDEAVASYERALKFLPDLADSQTGLAAALRSQGRTLKAIQVLFGGLASQPSNVSLRRSLAESLRGFSLDTIGERERAILLSLCTDRNISTNDLAIAIISLLKNTPAFSSLRSAVHAGDDPFATAASETDAFTRDPLLLAALPRMAIYDIELELVLTHVRRNILLRTQWQNGLPAADPAVSHDFMCALARQCFHSQYAFFVAEDEERRACVLRSGLQAAMERLETNPLALEWPLLLSALYGSLSSLPDWERLLKPAHSQWNQSFRPILREQLIDCRREKEITGYLTAITDIDDEVSKAVRRQYEDNPYPVWVSVNNPQSMSAEELARRLRPGENVQAFPRPVPILVAGCGTGYHPIEVAMTFNDCKVLAVDLSRASLGYAVRMAELFGITNIDFHQADILKLNGLNRRFAVIECSGVLHHLKEPMMGWQVLVDLLEPGGLMQIGLYSERARRDIQAARKFAGAQGFPATPDGIRRCRRAIINLPSEHPARGALTAGDFFTLNGCRDLIMHSQEQTFTLPGIAEYLDRLGLRFLGFQCDAAILGRFRAMFPDYKALTDLALWDRFEEGHPESFKGMYQFWCCRKERSTS